MENESKDMRKKIKGSIIDVLTRHFVWLIKTNPRASEIVRRGNEMGKKFDTADFLVFIMSFITPPNNGAHDLLKRCRAIDKKFDSNFVKFQKKAGMVPVPKTSKNC